MNLSRSLYFISIIVYLFSFKINFSQATVFFEFDGEKGYQYMGSGNRHPGGGYFSWMGGTISKPAGTLPTSGSCTYGVDYDVTNYHYTVLSNETAAQGAVPGSQWSLKTPYTAACNREAYQKDTTIINIGQTLQEYYIRWYQKWTGNWYEADVQQKFFKPVAVGGDLGGAGLGQISFYWTGHNIFRAVVPNVDGHFDKDGITRASLVSVTATRAGSPPGCEYQGTTCGYDDDATTTSEFTFSTNTWYCIEVHAKVNTAGNSDGCMEVWVNNVKAMGIYNLKWFSGTVYGVNQIEMQHIYYNRSAVDEPTYMDDIVISDRYIGPVEVQPAPSPPKGLKIVR